MKLKLFPDRIVTRINYTTMTSYAYAYCRWILWGCCSY